MRGGRLVEVAAAVLLREGEGEGEREEREEAWREREARGEEALDDCRFRERFERVEASVWWSTPVGLDPVGESAAKGESSASAWWDPKMG